MKRFNSILVAVAFGCAALAFACGAPEPAAPKTPAETAAEQPTPHSGQGANITEAQAVEIAKEQVPGGTVVEVEFEANEKPPVWEVELTTESGRKEVEIEAATGKVLEVENDDGDDDDDDDGDDNDDDDDDDDDDGDDGDD